MASKCPLMLSNCGSAWESCIVEHADVIRPCAICRALMVIDDNLAALFFGREILKRNWWSLLRYVDSDTVGVEFMESPCSGGGGWAVGTNPYWP